MGQKGFYFDQTRCTGCRTCSVACSDLHNYAPDIVLRRVIEFEGGMPVCVEACPERALEFGDIEELRKKHGNNAAIAPLPDPAETKPCLTIRPCASAKPSGFKGGTAHRF